MSTVFKTNTLGPLLTTQAFLPLLRKGDKKQVRLGACAAYPGGQRPHLTYAGAPTQIVNVSSGLGSIQSLKEGLQTEPMPSIFTRALAYKSSKAALNMRAC